MRRPPQAAVTLIGGAAAPHSPKAAAMAALPARLPSPRHGSWVESDAAATAVAPVDTAPATTAGGSAGKGMPGDVDDVGAPEAGTEAGTEAAGIGTAGDTTAAEPLLTAEPALAAEPALTVEPALSEAAQNSPRKAARGGPEVIGLHSAAVLVLV